MKKWKKMFRMAGFVILKLCASTGLFAGALMLPRNREKYMNKEITTEQVEKERKKSGKELSVR
jgi:hypothetical protein